VIRKIRLEAAPMAAMLGTTSRIRMTIAAVTRTAATGVLYLWLRISSR
jgi:hypothetical protein